MTLSLTVSIILIIISNIFMSFAWYGQLKYFSGHGWLLTVLVSWSIAFFEYLFLIPAIRSASQFISVGQLRILQEVISLTVFIPFAIIILREPFKMDYLWAMLCLVGAIFFMFRDKLFS